MLRAAAVKRKRATLFVSSRVGGGLKSKIRTFKVVEEILFRRGEVGVGERACEGVEVESGFHVGGQSGRGGR